MFVKYACYRIAVVFLIKLNSFVNAVFNLIIINVDFNDWCAQCTQAIVYQSLSCSKARHMLPISIILRQWPQSSQMLILISCQPTEATQQVRQKQLQSHRSQ